MVWVILFVLLQPPERVPATPLTVEESARREALTRYGLGLMQTRRELPVQALKQFEAAAKADPASPVPLKSLVKSYADLGRYPAAIRTAKKALELDKNDYETAQLLGQILFDGKKYPDAIAALKQAVDSPTVAKLPAKRFGILRDLARVCDTAKDWPNLESAVRASLAIIAESRNALLSSPLFSDEVELNREQAVLQEKLGQALVGQKKFADAMTTFRNAAVLFQAVNDPIGAKRVSWNLSGVLLEQGDNEQAYAQLEQFLTLKPGGAAPYERQAELLRRLKRTNQISATLERQAQQNPKNEAIRWVLASELAIDNPAVAARLFREIADGTTDPKFFAQLVRFYTGVSNGKDLLDLVDRYSKAARAGRDDEEPGADRDAKARLAVERFRSLVAAMKVEPKLGELLIRQVRAEGQAMLVRQKDTRELIVWFAEQAGQIGVVETLLRAAVQAGNPEAIPALLTCLERQRKWVQEIELCNRLEAQQGVRAAYNWNAVRAQAYAEIGEGPKAMQAINNAGKSADIILLKAHILCTFERYPEALTLIQGILTEPNVTPKLKQSAQLRLAEAYNGLKQFDKADVVYRELLEDNPDSVLVLNNYAYNMADQGRNLADAEVMIRRAIEIEQDERIRAGSPDVNRGTYLDSLGWILFRRGKLADAKTVLEQAAQSADGAPDATVWDHLGDVYFRIGDQPKARTAWTKAAELFKDNHQGRQQGRRDEVLRKIQQ